MTFPGLLEGNGPPLGFSMGSAPYNHSSVFAMRQSDDLFDLIKAMSKQEKRYFKLYATFYTRESSNGYTRLFDAMDRLETYKEDELAQAIEHEPFAGYLATMKYRLATVILDCLASFHAEKTPAAELRTLLAHADILFAKGLYKQCRKVVNRARKKAQDAGEITALVDIAARERNLLFVKPEKNFDVLVTEHYGKTRSMLEQLHTIMHYRELRDAMYAVAGKYSSARSTELLHRLGLLAGEIQALPDGDDVPALARIDRNVALGSHALLTGSYTLAREYFRAALTLWENEEGLLHGDPDGFKRITANFCSCCLALNAFEDFCTAAEKAKRLPSHSLAGELTSFENIQALELMFYLNNGCLEEGLAHAHTVEKGLARFADMLRPNRRIPLHYNCCVLYFLCEEYGHSLRHANAILELKAGDELRDIREFARIFSLVLHFEAGNVELLDTIARSAKRYLKKHNRYSEFEQCVLQALRRIPGCPDVHAARSVYRGLRRQLIGILHAERAPEPLGLTELLFWTESKINGESLKTGFIRKMQDGRHLDKKELFPQAPTGDADSS